MQVESSRACCFPLMLLGPIPCGAATPVFATPVFATPVFATPAIAQDVAAAHSAIDTPALAAMTCASGALQASDQAFS